MKLLATEEEVDELIAGNFISPSIENDKEFILKVSSLSGSCLEITVIVDDTIPVTKTKKVTKVPQDVDNGHANVSEWITSWRKTWSGKRRNAMGSKDKCIKNMEEFFQLFPTYTKEHVFLARDKYFDSFQDDTRYLEQADYFIKKRVPDGDGSTETRRTLLIYCEEVLLDEEFGIDENFSTYDNV